MGSIIEPLKQTASTVNTFLLFATLGALGFIGNSAIDNSKMIHENAKRLEMIAASQIGRPEIDAKFSELRQEQQRMSMRLSEIELDLARIKARMP